MFRAHESRSRFAAAIQTGIARAVVGIAMRDRLKLLAERQRLHAGIADPGEIARWQLVAFNEVWHGARRRYRFYAEWQRRHRLPDRLETLAELDAFPVLRKAEVEANADSIAADAAPCRFIASGGSSGPSVPFPRDRRDDRLLHASMYLGRGGAGIRPGDSIVLIWGHDHLYAAGIRGRAAKLRRRTMDWLIGTKRLDVYRLDRETVAAYFAAIGARPGAVLVGYVSAIRKLLDHVELSGADGRAARLRAVIFCSETVFLSDLARVRRLLGSVPLIEYGMGETGVMAYSAPHTATLTFFWDAVHCRLAAASELIVTTLQPRLFPLISYGTGDRVEPAAGGPALPFRCTRILGRTRDVIDLMLRGGDMTEVHSELIEDCLDLVPDIRSYCVRQRGRIVDIAVRTAPGGDLRTVRHRFLRVLAEQVPDLDGAAFTFSPLESEPQTIAGKRLYVVREEA